MTSFRFAGVDETPGKDCITLEISRFEPGLLSISAVVMRLKETGLSSFFLKKEALTSTSFNSSSSSSKGISKFTTLALVTNIGSETYFL
jgi:hypothetical protein